MFAGLPLADPLTTSSHISLTRPQVDEVRHEENEAKDYTEADRGEHNGRYNGVPDPICKTDEGADEISDEHHDHDTEDSKNNVIFGRRDQSPCAPDHPRTKGCCQRVVETSLNRDEEVHEQHADENDQRGTPEKNHQVPHPAVSAFCPPD